MSNLHATPLENAERPAAPAPEHGSMPIATADDAAREAPPKPESVAPTVPEPVDPTKLPPVLETMTPNDAPAAHVPQAQTHGAAPVPANDYFVTKETHDAAEAKLAHAIAGKLNKNVIDPSLRLAIFEEAEEKTTGIKLCLSGDKLVGNHASTAHDLIAALHQHPAFAPLFAHEATKPHFVEEVDKANMVHVHIKHLSVPQYHALMDALATDTPLVLPEAHTKPAHEKIAHSATHGEHATPHAANDAGIGLVHGHAEHAKPHQPADAVIHQPAPPGTPPGGPTREAGDHPVAPAAAQPEHVLAEQKEHHGMLGHAPALAAGAAR
jgi:hypothetical protein